MTLAGSAAIVAVLLALSRWPWFVETLYARGISFQISRALSIVTGLVPVSVAGLIFAGLVLFLVVPLVLAVVQIVRRQRRVLEALGAGTLRFLAGSMVVLALFYLFWGLNYSRAPLNERLGWPQIESATDEAGAVRLVDEMAGVTTELVEAANASYRAVAGSDDLGRPSTAPDPSRPVDADFDVAFERVQRSLHLEPQLAARRGRAKPFLFSGILNHLELTGFFFPWAGESQYNRYAPAMTLPHTVAHEKAHQRGIAREDEANFIGFLVCVMSDDPFAQYSGYLFAQRQLLGELSRRSPDRSMPLVKLGAAGVWRDIQYIWKYWQQFDGLPARVSQTVNNSYLRSQGVRSGTASYAASQNLILLLARQHGGSIRAAVGAK